MEGSGGVFAEEGGEGGVRANHGEEWRTKRGSVGAMRAKG